MALASSIALIVLVVAGALGWRSARTLPRAANFGILRRQAIAALASGVTVVAAGAVSIGTAVLQSGTGPGWAGPVRATLVAVPMLLTLTLAIPRLWVVARRRPADPLHWPDGRVRAEVAGPELVVPFAAGTVAALALVALPSVTPLAQLGFAAFGVLAATAYVDARQRRRRAAVSRPIEPAELSWHRVLEPSSATH